MRLLWSSKKKDSPPTSAPPDEHALQTRADKAAFVALLVIGPVVSVWLALHGRTIEAMNVLYAVTPILIRLLYNIRSAR
jgi:hypothetical protein